MSLLYRETERMFNLTNHQALIAVSYKFFQMISDELNVNTAYVTRRDPKAMMVLSSFNKNEMIIPEGYAVDYGETYCRLIIQNDEDVMHTNNLATFNLTQELEVTEQLSVKGFLGVTLRDHNGDVFGTLCVMDKQEKNFTEENIAFLKNIADILSYVIDLDETSRNLDLLSVPIIPIKAGVAILSLQGNINATRSTKILEETLDYAAINKVRYFIVDLSQLLLLEHRFPAVLKNIFMSLKIMGVRVFVTGLTAEIVQKGAARDELIDLDIAFVKNIEEALNEVGYTLN